MNTIECPQLCPDCPLRDANNEPALMAEIRCTVPAKVSRERNIYSFELENGMPVGPRLSTIAIANGDRLISATFEVQGSDWDNGTVVNAFDKCDKPTEIRSGLFGLKKRVGCTALKNLNR